MDEGPMDAVYLLLISIAVFLFIYAGCSMNAYELLVENEAYHRKSMVTAIPGSIMSPSVVLPSFMSDWECCLAKRHGEQAGFSSPLHG